MTPVGCIHEDQHCVACNGNQDLSSIRLDKKRAACRYYQTGNCRRGSNCPFAHISVAAQVETPIPHPAYLAAEQMYTYYPLGQTPVYHPLGSQAHPLFLWQPYAPLSPSFDPRYGLVCQTENLSDYPDDKSDPSSTESSSTAASIDYQLRMALGAVRLEGLESGGVANPPNDLGASLSPGYPGYSYPGFPGVKNERVGGGDCQYPDPSPFLLSWQDDPRKKPLAYKTKPCKFYTTSGTCTSGDKCTFIHDPESKGTAKRPPPKPALPAEAKLPPKPRDKYEDCRARDFYPITWRVIGGGVMMGGQRQICPAFTAGQCKYGNDCKLAHETDLETDNIGFIEPKSESASPPQLARGTTPKRVRASTQRKSTQVPPPETPQPVIFPSTTPRPRRPNVPPLDVEAARKKANEVVVSSAPPSPMHRRTQSMSMVVTSPLDATHPNYAAEL